MRSSAMVQWKCELQSFTADITELADALGVLSDEWPELLKRLLQRLDHVRLTPPCAIPRSATTMRLSQTAES